MWHIICQQNVLRLTSEAVTILYDYKTVTWPTGWDGSVGLLDGYNASKWLRCSNMVKFIWSGDIKQTKGGSIRIYVGYYMST